jgi:hypothetical protein
MYLVPVKYAGLYIYIRVDHKNCREFIEIKYLKLKLFRQTSICMSAAMGYYGAIQQKLLKAQLHLQSKLTMTQISKNST